MIWTIYYWASAILSIYYLIKWFPVKGSKTDNIGGSVLVGLALGWLIWPFIWCAVRIKKGQI